MKIAKLLIVISPLLIVIGVILIPKELSPETKAYFSILPTADMEQVSNESSPAIIGDTLSILSLETTAEVVSVGLTKTGEIGTPSNLSKVAWYNGSAAIGEKGVTIIDGHIGSPSEDGVFKKLPKLKNEEIITYQKQDGTTYTYKVTESRAYPNSSETAQHLFDQLSNEPTLKLITCYGKWVEKEKDFDRRWIVTATLINKEPL